MLIYSMEIYNFNLGIIALLMFLLTIKYMPTFIPNVPFVKTLSDSFVKRIGPILLLCGILFWFAVWLKLNNIDFSEEYPNKNQNTGVQEIGTITI